MITPLNSKKRAVADTGHLVPDGILRQQLIHGLRQILRASWLREKDPFQELAATVQRLADIEEGTIASSAIAKDADGDVKMTVLQENKGGQQRRGRQRGPRPDDTIKQGDTKKIHRLSYA